MADPTTPQTERIIGSRQQMRQHGRRRWLPVLCEYHQTDCACSICESLRYAGHRSVGFLAPQDKVWNGWRRVFYVTRSGVRYWRWTGFWQRQPNWRSR